MKRILNITLGESQRKKVTKFVGVVFALILAALNLPTTAWSGDIIHSGFKSANAAFFNTTNPTGCNCISDPTTCILAGVFAFATEDKLQSPPGPGGSSSSAQIMIFQNDCTFAQLRAADCFPSGPLADQDFQVSQNLDSATLNAAFECFGFDFVSELPWDFNVDVDLTWTGTGDIIRFKSNSHNSFPGCIFNEQINFTSRPAEASGTVSDETANFTPNPSANANIDSAKIGQVSIDCQ